MKTSVLAFALFAFSISVKVKALLVALAASAGILGTTITAQTPGPLVGPNSPDADSTPGQAANIPFQYEVLTGTTDVITGGSGLLNTVPGSSAATVAPISGTSFIETAGVDACTLAQPVAGAPSAGGNDGLDITIIDNGGHAHTITCAASGITPAHHLATFNGTQGSFVTFIARNGKWLVLASSGVTIS